MHSPSQACANNTSVDISTHEQRQTAHDTAATPYCAASAPGHLNQWPGSVSITVGMHSPFQPRATSATIGGVLTSGQRTTAYDTTAVYSLPALTLGYSNLWPGSEITTEGMHSPSQSCASSDASGSSLTHGKPTAAHDTAAKPSHAAAQATLWPASVPFSDGAHSAFQPVTIPAIVQRWQSLGLGFKFPPPSTGSYTGQQLTPFHAAPLHSSSLQRPQQKLRPTHTQVRRIDARLNSGPCGAEQGRLLRPCSQRCLSGVWQNRSHSRHLPI
jgi:hypothetical protein